MNAIEPHLAVRAVSLYLPIVLMAAAVVSTKPRRREMIGAAMTLAWNVPAILALHVVAAEAGWWSFEADGGLLLDMPIDLWIAWAILWGPLPAIAFRSLPLPIVLLIALAFDLVMMPAASPVVRLAPDWLVGEAAGLLCCLWPAQLLARWTSHDRRLAGRALMQVVAFSGLMLWLIPVLAVQGSGTSWRNPFDWPMPVLSLAMQLVAVPALLGLAAVQEFVTRGAGTPIPYDPPRHIVMTGPYAYVANPMQLSAVVLLLILGIALWNVWVAAAGVMAHIYSAGIAGWDEDQDLLSRFGAAWPAYRSRVRKWIPHFRPWYRDDCAVATLYVSEECGMCSAVGAWFLKRAVRGLAIVAAEDHPRGGLTRITYESADGLYRATGTDAIGRALEHVHFGWAFAGFAMRLPVVSIVIQLIVDASGGEPRTIRRRMPGPA
jgi:protein-S-isoprenylcysteine O-methyltransferase Ste14